MASDDDELPQKLDLRDLQVREQVASGAAATFWKAAYNGQDIALKILNPKPKTKAGANTAADGCATLPNDKELREKMFLREAKISLQLGHRHIARCFGVAQLPGGFVPGQTAPALAMALELCEPQTLKDLITRGMAAGRRPYKTGEAYRWLIQVASALSSLHSQKPPILHRDIRADSILTKRASGTSDWSCKLSDFGLHAVLYEDRSNALRRRAFTQTIFNPLADAAATDDSSQRAGNAAEMGAVASETEPERLAGRDGVGTSKPTPSAENSSHAALGTARLGHAHGLAGPAATATVSCKPTNGVTRGGDPQELDRGGARVNGGLPNPGPASTALLGNVENLLKQLGVSELQPLQPQEMELVYSWPDKAESFLYMAPEVFNNLPSTERSDVFSFGVLAYELLGGELLSIGIFNTGRAARMGVHDPQGYAAKVAEGFRPARIQALSDAAWSLIESCWHADPGQRPSMAVVEEQMTRLVAELEGGAPPASPPGSSPRNAKMPWEVTPGSGKAPRAPVDGPSPGCTQQCVIS